MTPSTEGSTTHIRREHRSDAPIAVVERQAAGTGGTVSGGRSDVDPRFQRVADLAANLEGLSKLTQTMILRRVEPKMKQSVVGRQSGPANASATTPAAMPQTDSASSTPEHYSPSERMKSIEHLLKAIRRAYGAINKFMSTGGSTDQANTDRESMR